MARARVRLLTLTALCGVAIVLLSFGLWIRFSSINYEPGTELINPVAIELKGTETSRTRDKEEILKGDVPEEDGWCSCRVSFGDGYITAVLGALVLMAAAGALATTRDRPFAIGIIGASVGALLLAGYNAIADWHALVWTKLGQTEFVNGNAEPALWALIVVAAIAAILGAALWTLARAEEQDEWDEEEDWFDSSAQPMNSLTMGRPIATQRKTTWA